MRTEAKIEENSEVRQGEYYQYIIMCIRDEFRKRDREDDNSKFEMKY